MKRKVTERFEAAAARLAGARCLVRAGLGRAARIVREERAQGTTEYGVLVVIAIIAIIAFRDRVSELWTAIADGINKL